MAIFVLTPGVDNFTGNPGENNFFDFTTGDLQATDTTTGGATGAFIDVLRLTAPATVTAAQYAGATNIEELVLANGVGNHVTLANSMVLGTTLSSGALFNVLGGTGNDIIDGHLVSGTGLFVVAGLGADQITGGSNVDSVSYAGSSVGVNVNLATGIGFGGEAQGDQLAGIENIVGSAFADLLTGDGGNNSLGGGTGQDDMRGGAGNDQYGVDQTNDVIVENAGEGNDIVFATADYTLPANVDSVVLLGSANLNANGNADNNALIGNSGNNVLDGKGGDDTMTGGAGNDQYFIDSTSDAVIENPGEGNDIVHATVDYTIGANIESVILEGTGNINAVGSGDNNALVGNSGNNTLDGAGGDDVMIGGAGNDIYFIDSTSDVVTELA